MSLDEKDPVDEIDVILLCRTDGTLETDDLFRLNNYGTSVSIVMPPVPVILIPPGI